MLIACSDIFYPVIKALILKDNYLGTLFSVMSGAPSKHEKFLRFAAMSTIVLSESWLENPGLDGYHDILIHSYVSRLVQNYQVQASLYLHLYLKFAVCL